VPVSEFNSFGARRGNHEVMMRGTFGNVRIKNLMLPVKPDRLAHRGPASPFTSRPASTCRSTRRR